MPAVDKLLLEEALQDSPQARSLLSVFEEDAGTLTDYTNQLLQAMQRVYGAQNFALGKGDEEVISTLHYFSKVMDELNGLHTELAKQLADTMVLPVIQFREKDLTEVSTLKDLFGLASSEHDLSMAKYSRLPKKKENEKAKTEIVKEVAAARRKQHLSSLQYYCALNALQYRKRAAMMEPLIGFAHGQINFFKRGAEMFSKSMDGFLSSVKDMVQSIQFDIVLPATEFLDQNRGGRRTNPFGETEDGSFPEAEDSLLQQMFIVRFLGSMAVKTDSTAEVIYEAMRQVLAARAIHNIFRMTESHLMVTSQTLRLIDPQTQVSRACFELTSVTQFAAHQENKRLVGFVIRVPESTGEESLSTYIFESNSEGEKICYAINLGKEIIEVQKDPEALARLMLSVPLTNDGKYVLLNDQADDTGGSPSENRGAESEA